MAGFLVVDRIENGIAACEMPDRAMRMIPLSKLPDGVAEGDVLTEHHGSYAIDRGETQRRREYNRSLFEQLRERWKGEEQ